MRAEYARQLLATGLVPDPWLRGEPRFHEEPLLLPAATWAELAGVAEAVAEAFEAGVRLVAQDASLAREFLGLTPWQMALWQSQPRFWHALARADVFLRADGPPVVCEINSDTPTGWPEALATGRLAARPGAVDPNARLEQRLLAVLRRMADQLPVHAPRRAALVYPTDQPEDLAWVGLLGRLALQLPGFQLVLGAPEEIGVSADGWPTLRGQEAPFVLRHVKTDAWAEQLPIWQQEDPAEDLLPLVEPAQHLLQALERRQAVVVNPFSSVLTQNKRFLALLWERQHRLPAQAAATVRAHLPETRRFESVHREDLLARRAEWVLKSDYGCEGGEVFVGAETPPEVWEDAVASVIPERWVVQRYFHARNERDEARCNFGVYLCGGQASGVYARLDRLSTTYASPTVPILVEAP